VIDHTRHPRLLMLDPRREVAKKELDALSEDIRRQKVGDSLSVRVDLLALSLDKRLRQPAPSKASSA
jgi:hypothetical protein